MKNVLKSKTVWFNTLTILVMLATVFGYTPDQELANQTANVLVVVAPAVNLILRYFTNSSVAILPQKCYNCSNEG